jgi:hypothetical protein
VLLCLLFIVSGETNFFQIISNNRLWIIPGFLFGLFKIGLSVTTVGLSAYSVYIANELSQIPQQVID